jgi:hypothetical protein
MMTRLPKMNPRRVLPLSPHFALNTTSIHACTTSSSGNDNARAVKVKYFWKIYFLLATLSIGGYRWPAMLTRLVPLRCTITQFISSLLLILSDSSCVTSRSKKGENGKEVTGTLECAYACPPTYIFVAQFLVPFGGAHAASSHELVGMWGQPIFSAAQ